MDKTNGQTTFDELFRANSSPASHTHKKSHKKQTPSDYISIDKELEKYSTATDAEETYFLSGITASEQRKVKKGKLSIRLSCDLHGYNKRDAIVTVNQFLQDAQSQKQRYVLIIFGKGKLSRNNRPILKPVILSLLKNTPQVIGYTMALPADGGKGAAYVILKNLR